MSNFYQVEAFPQNAHPHLEDFGEFKAEALARFNALVDCGVTPCGGEAVLYNNGEAVASFFWFPKG